jgi:hypothetical protein
MGQGGEALPVIDALGCLRSLMGQGGEALPVIDALGCLRSLMGNCYRNNNTMISMYTLAGVRAVSGTADSPGFPGLSARLAIGANSQQFGAHGQTRAAAT